MKVNVVSLDNKKGAEVELNDALFGLELRKDVLHRVVEWQRAKRQSGTHKVLERGEVHGTTKKPFAQKGTGNARQGSLKGPHQRGGGNAHGPRVRSHAYSLTKKFRQLGLRTALSLKAAEGKLHIVETASLKEAKTKDLSAKLDKLGLDNALFIDAAVDVNFLKAANNIKHIDILPQIGANVYDILKHDSLVLTVDALKLLEERLA
jgi:large subunit ribosomal protein L4